MSSLAATQADGYYLPPEYYESQGKKSKPLSKNQWYATQQKNKSSKGGHNQFLTNGVVRFELPYPALCLHCSSFIARGTRFNAHKQRTGESYHSTEIWQFSMTCRACGVQTFVIRTDPAARGFRFIQGLQKLERNAKHHEDETTGQGNSASSSLELIERDTQNQKRAKSEFEELQAVQRSNDSRFRNDADGNSLVRARFRADRTSRKRRREEETRAGWSRTGLRLLDKQQKDEAISKEMTYGDGQKQEKDRLKKVRRASIFSRGSQSKSRKSSATDKDDEHDVRPDGVRSSAAGSTRRHRRKRQQREINTVDLTDDTKPRETTKKQVRTIMPRNYKSSEEGNKGSLVKDGSPALSALLGYSSDDE